jgi:hypothetical protein
MENKGVTQIPILRDTTTTWNYFSGKLLLCRYYLSEKGVPGTQICPNSQFCTPSMHID